MWRNERGTHFIPLFRFIPVTLAAIRGCRGFTGPVPPPLWIRASQAIRLAAMIAQKEKGVKARVAESVEQLFYGLPTVTPNVSEGSRRAMHGATKTRFLAALGMTVGGFFDTFDLVRGCPI